MPREKRRGDAARGASLEFIRCQSAPSKLGFADRTGVQADTFHKTAQTITERRARCQEVRQPTLRRVGGFSVFGLPVWALRGIRSVPRGCVAALRGACGCPAAALLVRVLPNKGRYFNISLNRHSRVRGNPEGWGAHPISILDLPTPVTGAPGMMIDEGQSRGIAPKRKDGRRWRRRSNRLVDALVHFRELPASAFFHALVSPGSLLQRNHHNQRAQDNHQVNQEGRTDNRVELR